MGDTLLLAFLFLVAGVVAVPIASRLGLGSVLGYLVAGVAISPILAAAEVDVISIQHFAEFGVVMMLFLVGLELEPKLLWEMRSKLLGLGGLQVVATGAIAAVVAIAFGLSWTVGVAIGAILALSSTAIVLQTLNEKGLMRSDGGQSSFAVLLFQDIAVIPILAFFPLLASGTASPPAEHAEHAEQAAHAAGGGDHGATLSLVEGLAPWQQGLVTVLAVAFVVLGGIYLSRPLFRLLATTKLRELFTAAALGLVVGIALLMTVVGLSPALGTFLAGVVLANSEYRHELESAVEPFKGLLLGLFFITVGASVDFALLASEFGQILGITVAVMVGKAAVLFGLSLIFLRSAADGGGRSRWLFTLSLAQAGEFGFVLLSFTQQQGILPAAIAERMLLVVALSMLLTPGLFILYERVIARRAIDGPERAADEIDETNPIIIAGHGRWGGIVNRMLRGNGYHTTVLDYSAEQLDMLRAFGLKVFYGDATRPDLLLAAGIARARMLIVAIDDRHAITELVAYVRRTYPDVYVIARAVDRAHVYELYGVGCRDIIRETFDSAVRGGRSAFEALGCHPYEAERLARRFVRHDRDAIVRLAEVYDPAMPMHQNAEYVERAKQIRDEMEAEMRGGDRTFDQRIERAWSPPTTRDVEAAEAAD